MGEGTPPLPRGRAHLQDGLAQVRGVLVVDEVDPVPAPPRDGVALLRLAGEEVVGAPLGVVQPAQPHHVPAGGPHEVLGHQQPVRLVGGVPAVRGHRRVLAERPPVALRGVHARARGEEERPAAVPQLERRRHRRRVAPRRRPRGRRREQHVREPLGGFGARGVGGQRQPGLEAPLPQLGVLRRRVGLGHHAAAAGLARPRPAGPHRPAQHARAHHQQGARVLARRPALLGLRRGRRGRGGAARGPRPSPSPRTAGSGGPGCGGPGGEGGGRAAGCGRAGPPGGGGCPPGCPRRGHLSPSLSLLPQGLLLLAHAPEGSGCVTAPGLSAGGVDGVPRGGAGGGFTTCPRRAQGPERRPGGSRLSQSSPHRLLAAERRPRAVAPSCIASTAGVLPRPALDGRRIPAEFAPPAAPERGRGGVGRAGPRSDRLRNAFRREPTTTFFWFGLSAGRLSLQGLSLSLQGLGFTAAACC